MPESSRRVPQPAQVEDCESDESSAKPGTARRATRRSQSSRPPRVVQRRADSDSGYSSHASAAVAAAPTQTIAVGPAATRQAATTSPAKSKPIIHSIQTQQAKLKAPSRSASMSRHCTDPKCPEPNCASKRNPERRYTLPQNVDPAQYAAAMAQYQQPVQTAHPSSRQYQYPPQYSSTPAVQTMPAVTPQARPRATSTSRSRPVSIHGYGSVSAYSGQPQPHGPPPSPSAYRNYLANYYQQYQQPPVYGSTPPMQTMSTYPPASPIVPSPTNATYPTAPGLSRTYSAREVNPATITYGISKPAPQYPLRNMSARHTTTAARGALPDPESSETESESDVQSETDYEAERERERERRARARDSKMMPPPSRRPSIKERKTTTAVPLRMQREPLPRAPRSDTDVDYPSSSDYVDSDRTARAVVDRPRTNSSYSSRSRRQSVSTTASSGRTKATTVSSGSGSGKYIIEDRHGRRKEYLSREQYDELIRRAEQQKREERELEERAEAYQRQVRGRQPPELTAENIRKASQRRQSASHVSGHSRKSGHSSKNSKNDGIRIQSGDTVLHVYGEARVEMRPGEDGAPAFIIGSTSSRDSAYHTGSKSSGSRVSRRKDTITEEDGGYEKGL